MHNFNLKMIKVIMVILVATVVLNMVGGIKILKNNYYWRDQFFQMQLDYFKVKSKWLLFQKNNISSSDSMEKNAGSIPILLYHGVIRDPDWNPDEVSIRLKDFQDQMFALKNAGWQTIKLEDYLAFIRGEKNLPEKSFMLTFDDGRNDSFYPVDPILKTLDYSAVMFVITGRSLDPENKLGNFHLSKMELQKMLKSGRWQMASHTQNGHGYEAIGPNGETGHFLSNRLWIKDKNRMETDDEYKARIYNDILNSKKDLENNLGIEALAFAYPFGDFGETTQNFPESHGELLDEVRKIYPLSFCQTASGDFPSNYQEGSFLAKRINVDSFTTPDKILQIFNTNEDKATNYRDDFSTNKGWVEGWGKMEISQNSLIIKNSQEEDSGLAFLNGSYLWKNYSAKAKIKLVKNGKASLAVRYHDGNNYVSCDFSQNSVSLTQKINKILTREVVVPMDTALTSGREAEIEAKVNGENASCYLDGKELISETIDENLSRGGVSFKVWNPNEKDSAIVVSGFSVSNIPPNNAS